MKKLFFLYVLLMFPAISLAEGRMYENKKEPHCTLWDTMRLKWPQTIMGREKIKCRRRAALSNTTPVTCRFKSWKWGQLSAIVEPIFAVIGAAIVISVYPILPYALAFAAGAMIFIVVEEVIPESQSGGNADIATMGLIAGFIVMMCLDVALG